MISAVKSRKGLTLAEILVSLALVAIITAMTASFVALITERTRVNRENETLREDRALIQSGVESWITKMLSDGYSITLEDPKTENDTTVSPALKATKDANSFTLSFAYDKLTGATSDSESIVLSTEMVTGISFETKTSNDKTIYFCTVKSDNNVSYTFCIYPRIGEAVSGQ